MKGPAFFLLVFLIQFQISGQLVKSFLIDEKGRGADSTQAKYTRIVFWNRFKQLSFKDHGLQDLKLYQSGSIFPDTLQGNRLVDYPVKYWRNGVCTTYHANGRKKLEGSYKNGIPVGEFSEWYSNGKQKGKYQYENMEEQKNPYDHEYRVISFFDRNGKQLVENGAGRYFERTDDSKGNGRVTLGYKNGRWTGYFEVEGETFEYEEFYRNGQLEYGISTDSKKQTERYKELHVLPKFREGIQSFYIFVGRHVRYPKSARRVGITGNVYVMFTVDEEGSTTDLKIAKSLQEDCDAQALKAVDKADHFTPAYYRGRKVKLRMVMPILFTNNG
ncbi:MAG: TonB family protein [Cytophagales bacterium]|nr:TonB family protein [Cytophagales bacterium]